VLLEAGQPGHRVLDREGDALLDVDRRRPSTTVLTCTWTFVMSERHRSAGARS
jgi:hypothetical protein